MTESPPRAEPRTAKATAARRRQSEEHRAAYLRERGWTCQPPDDAAPTLRAVLRAVETRGAGRDTVRVVIGPGDAARTTDILTMPGTLPAPSTDPAVLRKRFGPITSALRSYGNESTETSWTVGVDQRGQYAATWCRYVGGGAGEVADLLRID